MSVVPAEVATLVDSSVAKSSLQFWQPHVHTHTQTRRRGQKQYTHTLSQPLRKGAFCVPVLQDEARKRKSESIELFYYADLTRRVFFSFLFFVVINLKIEILSRLRQKPALIQTTI